MASSWRGQAIPTPASKAYVINGTRVNESRASKLTRAEKARRDHNEILRTPKCMRCGSPRERRAGLLCNKCEGGADGQEIIN